MAGVEGALARHQRLSLLALAGLVLLAWGWLLLGAGMGMAPMASLGPAGIGRAGASDDMMAVMMAVDKAGKIVEFGPSETIYAHPKEDYTRRLIDAPPKDSLENIRRRQKEREQALAKRVG